MTKYACSESKLTALGDAIRDKAGTTGKMTLDEMATAVEGISTGYELPEGLTYYTAKSSVPDADSSASYPPSCGSTDIVAAIVPNATSIGSYAFKECTALTSIELPNATSIGGYAFDNCSALTSIELPNATKIKYGCFYGCSALTSIKLPSIVNVDASAFYQLKALTVVDFGKVESFGQYAFDNCSALTNIVIRQSEKVCSMTLYFGQPGLYRRCNNLTAIYVPDALVDSYKSDDDWSSYASMIKPLSEYEG